MSILDQAELALRTSDYSGSGALLDKSGNGRDGTISGAVFKKPDGWTGPHNRGIQFVHTPNINGNYLSAPNISAYDVTNIDVRVALRYTWQNGADVGFFSLHDQTGDGSGWAFGYSVTERLRWWWAEAGVTPDEYVSTSGTFTAGGDGDLIIVRLTVLVDNGSNDADVKFLYKLVEPEDAYSEAASNLGWTQFGSTQQVGYVPTLITPTVPLKVCAKYASSMVATGDYYAVVFMDDIDGTPVFAIDLTDREEVTLPAQTFTEKSSNEATVSFNRAAHPDAQMALIDKALMLFASTYSSSITITHHANLNILVTSSPGTVVVVMRCHFFDQSYYFAGKNDSIAPTVSDGWALMGQSTADGKVYGVLGDGGGDASNVLSADQSSQLGQEKAFAMVATASANKMFVNEVEEDDDTPPSEDGSSTQTNNMWVGAYAAVTGWARFEFLGVALYQDELTVAELAETRLALLGYEPGAGGGSLGRLIDVGDPFSIVEIV